MLDANAAPLIGAWCYVEASGDRKWLAFQIEKLELIAEFMARHDADGDGLIELKRSGNYGEMTGYNSAWDCYNQGHKDGYSNLLAYRAWRCLSDLEGQLGRRERQARYKQLADRLKASFAKTLYNPATGGRAGVETADGQLHDYAWPSITGMAVAYGVVEPAQGARCSPVSGKKVGEVGFKRFDLGLPCTLVPVRRGDYIGKPQFDAMGRGRRGPVRQIPQRRLLRVGYDRLPDGQLHRRRTGKGGPHSAPCWSANSGADFRTATATAASS